MRNRNYRPLSQFTIDADAAFGRLHARIIAFGVPAQNVPNVLAFKTASRPLTKRERLVSFEETLEDWAQELANLPQSAAVDDMRADIHLAIDWIGTLVM